MGVACQGDGIGLGCADVHAAIDQGGIDTDQVQHETIAQLARERRLAGGGGSHQKDGQRAMIGRRSRTTPRFPRHREMRAFVSCMAWRPISRPLSKRLRRLDSLASAVIVYPVLREAF